MKKLFALLLAGIIAITAAFVLTGCSADKNTLGTDEPTTAGIAGAMENNIENTTEVDTPIPNDLAALVAQQNAALEAVNAQAAGQFRAEVKADGKKLVYSYIYAVDLPDAIIQATLEQMGASYGGEVGSYRAAGYDIDAVVIEFLDQGGKVIASKEYN